jgi:hypothetical protein
MEAVDMTATLAPHHIPGYRTIPEYRPGEPLAICEDFGTPLWPVLWNYWRHGSYGYRITAHGPDGEELPVTFESAGPVTVINWYARRKPRLRLGEYHRRQRARVKRRKR